jgi:hypothetical protein
MVYDPPLNYIIAGLLVGLAVSSGARGVRRLRRSLREALPIEVVRGIRGCVVAVAAAAVAFGVLSAQTGFVVFGMVFVAEELYETAVLAGIIKWGEHADI